MSTIGHEDIFEQLLDKQVYYFIGLKRLYKLQIKIIESCEGRPIKNDLIYQQILFASLDGLFVRMCNFRDHLFSFINILKNDHLDRFKRNNKCNLVVDPCEVVTGNFKERGVDDFTAGILTKNLQNCFDETYDRLFPRVKKENRRRPNHEDFDLISKELREVFVPIKKHRDTVATHWDEKEEAANIHDLKKVMEYLEYFLGALQSISRAITQNFELGGSTADVKRTATDLVELILGEYRVRTAKKDEMEQIYLMGFDVCSGGQDRNEYLKDCAESPKCQGVLVCS